jgi:hypothetical protein
VIEITVPPRIVPQLRWTCAPGRRLLLWQAGLPVLAAVVDPLWEGVSLRRLAVGRPVLAAVGPPDAAGGWERAFGRGLLSGAPPGHRGPLYPAPWWLVRGLVRPDGPVAAAGTLAAARAATAAAPRVRLDWTAATAALLALRPPTASAGGPAHTAALRRAARRGTLPPVLAWYVAGLDAWLVLDGHDRLAAAVAESVPPPVVTLLPAPVGAGGPAQRCADMGRRYADMGRRMAERSARGGNLARAVCGAPPGSAAPFGATRTWPQPGGVRRWREVVHRADPGWLYEVDPLAA